MYEQKDSDLGRFGHLFGPMEGRKTCIEIAGNHQNQAGKMEARVTAGTHMSGCLAEPRLLKVMSVGKIPTVPFPISRNNFGGTTTRTSLPNPKRQEKERKTANILECTDSQKWGPRHPPVHDPCQVLLLSWQPLLPLVYSHNDRLGFVWLVLPIIMGVAQKTMKLRSDEIWEVESFVKILHIRACMHSGSKASAGVRGPAITRIHPSLPRSVMQPTSYSQTIEDESEIPDDDPSKKISPCPNSPSIHNTVQERNPLYPVQSFYELESRHYGPDHPFEDCSRRLSRAAHYGGPKDPWVLGGKA
ncbi:hypothetical protein ACLOJK_006047 [Asimina triloba]